MSKRMQIGMQPAKMSFSALMERLINQNHELYMKSHPGSWLFLAQESNKILQLRFVPEQSRKESRAGMSQSTKAERSPPRPEQRDSFSPEQNGMANVMEGITSVRRGLQPHTNDYANN